ncbi:nucleotide-binding domain-containing protein [Microstroma glucosiphilum]|uniref:Nucleotide-binding domain-containing protein n=1 Tax=Pseudomicrostroma glucosiphilum TaxID=1684307 RepID=A0A316UEP3_9BASI|nr:nucleotide-binding domain-containing protein [Pseudomicrostroma glucosiphilum]PWN21575.1 nucleotide-binding domain-containing protein [Pseudomicrostroma glucosiphilum]
MSPANGHVNGGSGSGSVSASSSVSSSQPLNGKASPSSKAPGGKARKRVLVVGAGSAGMSAAYSLSLSPGEFEVVVYDKAPTAGGSATSYQLPDPKYYGADYINDGVQGASPVFYNTFKMFEDVLGFKSTEVGLQISFGKGKETFWSNVFPSELVDKFSDDIKKFGKTLHTIKRFEPIFAMIPVDRMLKMFRFSPDFGERMLLPLVALFFGTGNETKHVSSAIVERVFLDPSMRLFEFSEESLLASVPKMMSFPELSRLYGAWRRKVEENGNVRVETSREVFEIYRGTNEAKQKGGNILAKSRIADVREEVFDELIMACDADSALKILQAGSGPSWKEKKVLGNVKYKWDITVTHNDMDYMKKHYQMTYDSKYNAERDDEESKKAFKYAEENWRPLYLIKMYEKDPSFIEMSFDLTHYQGQFKGNSPVGPGARIKEEDAPPSERKASNNNPTTDAHKDPNHEEPPYDQHVFQTIYLNNDMNDWWTKEEVAKDKIICETWWKQQSHAASHFRGTVPFMWAINGPNHTQYAGAWTLINMHEIGICSAFSAAYAIGGKYPFKDDENCARLFKLYHGLSRLSRVRAEDRKGFFA